MAISRFKAFFIHLNISLVLLCLLLYLIIFHWYPSPFFTSDGGWQGIRIALGVDIVLGPLLTLILYKAGKPGLKFDLTLIALIQISALSWGTYTIYNQRPILMAFVEDRFYSMNHAQVQEAGVDLAKIQPAQQATPFAVYMRFPDNIPSVLAFKRETIARTHKPIYMLGHLYEAVTAQNICHLAAKTQDLDILMMDDPANETKLKNFLAKHGGRLYDYIYIPLHCRYQDALLALNRTNGQIVDLLDIRMERY